MASSFGVYPFITPPVFSPSTSFGRYMQSAMEKLSNIASVAKEKMTICKAKVEEQAEKATARTTEQKEVAHERRKAKQARAKMKLHQTKAKHAEEKLSRRTHHVSGQPVTPPVVGTDRYHQQWPLPQHQPLFPPLIEQDGTMHCK